MEDQLMKISKKILSFALALVMVLSLGAIFIQNVPAAAAVTQNQKNIAARADYLYGLTWVAQKTITAHAYSSYYTFYAGNTYHLPYGQGPTANYIGYGVTPEQFIKAAADPNSVFYAYKSSTGSWYSSYYITDCSGFVSWCWGLTAKQSTRSLANYSTRVGAVTTSNIINKLQIGDALNRYDYHVVLVTDLIYENGTLTGIEITEQTIPHTKRTIYTPSGLAQAYASYDGIYRYQGTVPAAPYTEPEKEETWIEKACFDVMVYRDRNPDIAHMTNDQLKEHWLEHGIKEGRASSTILDLGFYLNNNSDLKKAFGTDYEAVYNHFITKGYKEYRKSSALFDGGYYCKRYPEVSASYKEQYLRHYVENGMMEGRRASLTFDPNYYWFIRPDVAEAWPGDYRMAARHYAGHGINAQIEAYDHEYPVVTDIKVTDVTSAGYTITCKVTDNWGVSKVAFPTWTVANDQDDLPADFMNTQKGTKNGNTYTFRVKASDHNNEGGKYVTHIYAVDKGGNTTKLVMDLVTVEDPVQTVVPTLKVSGFSLSFEDEILVNFYYEVSDTTDVAEQGMLVFHTNPGSADIAKADRKYTGSTFTGGKYLNTSDGISAKEMGDDRYYCAYAKLTDGSYVYSSLCQYSPRQYAMSRLEQSNNEDLKALCVAMLNYGAAAQTYFGYKTDNLMNAGLTAAQKARVMDYSKDLFKGAPAWDKAHNFAATETFGQRGTSVSFDGAFAINYYFAPSAALAEDMTLYIWTPEAYASASRLTAANADIVTMVKQANGSYWAQVQGIAAKELDSTYYVAATYTDSNGNYHCTGIIPYSLSNYCMNKAVDGNSMQALAAATAMYGYYAEKYFLVN